MAKPLTAQAIERIKADPEKRLEIADGLLPGFYVVVQPSGRKSFAVRYRADGRPRKLTIGPFPRLSLADAREAARTALRAVDEGRDPAAEKKEARKGLSVAELIAEFQRLHVKGRNGVRWSAESARIFERDIVPRWGARRADSITRRNVIALLDEITGRGAPVQANRTFAAVRKLFKWAVSRDLLETSPCQGMSTPNAEMPRDRVLTDDEIRWLWRACERLPKTATRRGEAHIHFYDLFGPLVQLLLLTGQRESEVAGMSDAEIINGVWSLPGIRTKNGQPHSIAMPEGAEAILAALPRIPNAAGYLFSLSGRAPISGFSKAKRKLDELMLDEARKEAAETGEDPETVTIPAWRLHDLRRTAASGMARTGAALATIERALNHVSGSFGGIVGVYQRHSFADEVREALAAWDRHVQSVVDGDTNVIRLAEQK